MTTSDEKTGVDFSSVVAVVVIILVFWGIYSFFGWGEREGVVKYDDCRQIIALAPNTYQKYYKTFTCMYRRTGAGKIMGGECVHIDFINSWLTHSSECETAYVYEKKQEGGCTNPNFPFLGYDDKCHIIPQ